MLQSNPPRVSSLLNRLVMERVVIDVMFLISDDTEDREKSISILY